MSGIATHGVGRRCLVLVVYWGVMFGLTHWPEIDRYAPVPSWLPEHVDKIVHVVLYAGWTVIGCWVLAGSQGFVSRSALMGLFVVGLAWAILDESSQGLFRRQPSVGDFAADLLGITIVLVWFYKCRLRRMDGDVDA